MIFNKKWCQKNGIAIIPEELNSEHNEDKAPIKVAVPNANDELLLEKIRFITQQKIIPEQHSPAEIRLLQSRNETLDDEEIFKHLDVSRNSSWESEPIINLVDSLIEKALQKKATDIHLEPMTETIRSSSVRCPQATCSTTKRTATKTSSRFSGVLIPKAIKPPCGISLRSQWALAT